MPTLIPESNIDDRILSEQSCGLPAEQQNSGHRSDERKGVAMENVEQIAFKTSFETLAAAMEAGRSAGAANADGSDAGSIEASFRSAFVIDSDPWLMKQPIEAAPEIAVAPKKPLKQQAYAIVERVIFGKARRLAI